MSAKTQNLYICTNCDAQSLKWSGRCLECGTWGSLELRKVDGQEANKPDISAAPAKVVKFSDIKESALARVMTGIGEIDRVLGGGIVPGSLVLLAGEPGAGKSTIFAQISYILANINKNSPVLYVSGEESLMQIKDRFNRLGLRSDNISFSSEINIDKIISAAKELKPSLLIIDSVQTVYTGSVSAEPGSLSQIRGTTVSLLELAKENNIPVILIGHITKDGQIAGPKSLEHIVDTVIYLETETSHDYKILRATKNRFGSVNEIGIFEMTGQGFKEIKNPSAVFIETNSRAISGAVFSSVMEGTRPFLIEIQALVTKTAFGYPQRKASGFDLNRLQVLAAVMNKRGGVNLLNQDIILNLVGGMKADDTALDLAVCFAIASSVLNMTMGKDLIVLGEVGLGGEVRNISKLKERLSEAEKLGISKAIIPDMNIKTGKMELIKIKNIADIVKYITHNT